MASSTKILIPPSATTVERDNLPAVPNGSMIHNSTTAKVEYTIDGGSTWDIFASMDDLDLFSLQNGYDNGTGKIALSSSSKQFTVVGNLSAEPFAIPGLSTDIASSDVGNISLSNFIGRNGLGGSVNYASIGTDIVDNTVGSEDGRLTFSVENNGSKVDFLKIDSGVTVDVSGKYTYKFMQSTSSADVNYTGFIVTPNTTLFSYNYNGDGDSYAENNIIMQTFGLGRHGANEYKVVSSGIMQTYLTLNGSLQKSQFTTPVSYKDNLECETIIGVGTPDTGSIFTGIADEKLAAGEVVTISNTTDYRFKKVKVLDSTNVPIVGVAYTGAASPGSTFKIQTGPVLTSTTTNIVSRGHFILKSSITDGDVQGSATQVAGTFGVALSGAAASASVRYMRLYNVS